MSRFNPTKLPWFEEYSRRTYKINSRNGLLWRSSISDRPNTHTFYRLAAFIHLLVVIFRLIYTRQEREALIPHLYQTALIVQLIRKRIYVCQVCSGHFFFWIWFKGSAPLQIIIIIINILFCSFPFELNVNHLDERQAFFYCWLLVSSV